jgi:hypothetical protein
MEPLNKCLGSLRKNCLKSGLRWVAFTDADEFLFPVDKEHSIATSLAGLSAKHCITVPRLQYGSGGHIQRPDGLVIANYLKRAPFDSFKANKLPKLLVNLAPVNESRVVASLTNMHTPPGPDQRNTGPNACFGWPQKEQMPLRINHYLRSVEDYDVKLRHHFVGR